MKIGIKKEIYDFIDNTHEYYEPIKIFLCFLLFNKKLNFYIKRAVCSMRSINKICDLYRWMNSCGDNFSTYIVRRYSKVCGFIIC